MDRQYPSPKGWNVNVEKMRKERGTTHRSLYEPFVTHLQVFNPHYVELIFVQRILLPQLTLDETVHQHLRVLHHVVEGAFVGLDSE